MRERKSSRLLLLLVVLAGVPASRLPAQTVYEDEGWRQTGNRLVPRVRLTAEIVDSQPAVLEAEVKSGGELYTYSVDWGDGSRPEPGRRHGEGPLRLVHDYDGIGAYRIELEVRAGKQTTRFSPGLVSVGDDDDAIPQVVWTLPKPVLRPGEPAVVGWQISDESGLAGVLVAIQGPGGQIASFDTPQGQFDLTGRGLGSFGIELQTRDADGDRPYDSLGFMIIQTIVITDDVDHDGVLDYRDNCPRQPNPDQTDGDHDGLGDLCDPCPRVNGPCDQKPAGTATEGGPGEPPAPLTVLVLAVLLLVAASILRLRLAALRIASCHRFAAFWWCAGMLTASASLAAPVVTSIRPTASLVGEPIVIRGSGFGALQASGGVTFEDVDAGTVYLWTDTRIVVEVPVGSLVSGMPTPTPKGPRSVVVRTSSGDLSNASTLDIKVFNHLPPYRRACRCGDAGCAGPCLPDDYCRQGAGGCVFEARAFHRRDMKDIDLADLDDDGDLDVLDVSSPTQPGFPGDPEGGAGMSPTGCGAPVNFPDRLFRNDGTGHYSDVTGGSDGNYETGGNNAVPLFHSFRTYDADFVDVNNDGHLDIVRADRALCAADGHYFVNNGTYGAGVNWFTARSLEVAVKDSYWDNLATGDVEPDGDLDLLISHANLTGSHALLLNDGSGTFVPYTASMAGPRAADDDFLLYDVIAHDMYLVDLDGDRDQDIVIGGGTKDTSLPDFVMLNRQTETGNLFFETIPIPRASETTITVSLGVPDVNGDGRPDVHFVNQDRDRLFLNLGPIDCAGSCGDGLSCPATGLFVPNRICWQDATARLPEEIAGTSINGYGSDYGDVDADGDLDMLVTGLGWGSGNFLFLNQTFAACPATPCPTGYSCVFGGCRPDNPTVSPNWASCPAMGSGATLVPCVDRNGATVTGPGFPGVQVADRDLAMRFGDIDGDVDLDLVWGRGQWAFAPWLAWPDAGPLLLVADGERPYVKRVTVFSGPRIVYQAAWASNGAGTELVIAPATFEAAAPFTALRTQDLHIEVEFSEPMATAAITAITAITPTTLGVIPTLSSSQPAGGQTIWRGTISNLLIHDDGTHDGTYTITVTGTDAVGNQLLGITSRSNVPVGALRSGAAGDDTIHGFRIAPLMGEIPVTAIFMKQNPADPPLPLPADQASALNVKLDAYFGEVSYNEISFAVSGHGWFQLDHSLDWYSTNPRTPLVDMVQEAIDAAVAGGVDLSTAGYLLVVTDETVLRDEWSTSGGWPYTLGGGPRLIAAGVLNGATTDPRLNQLAGRLVGLVDLYAHPEVTFSRPFVGPWSLMGVRPAEEAVHVLGWEKWRAGWLDETGDATGKTLVRIQKPPLSTPISNRDEQLFPLNTGDDNQKMVAIELADGLYFTAEYRRQQGPLDGALPDAGVLLVKTNDAIPQGEGPAIVQDSTPADTLNPLDDAQFVLATPRNVFTDVGTGVSVQVTAMDDTHADIRINYTVPSDQNDVYVVGPNDQWVTEDIWIDAPATLAGGFEADPRTVQGANEQPVTFLVNKVIGRVRNSGPADATNFEVELEILEPWGTDGPWRSLKVQTVPLLQGQTTNSSHDVLIIADWVPSGDIHTCIRLRVRGVVNDVETTNNETQENIHEFDSAPSSPYTPITSRFQIKNPYAETVPVLFRLDGLPAGWSKIITPERPLLAPGEVATAQITLQPNNDAPLCTREQVTLTAYTPRVDTLKRLGTGITLAVELKSPAALDVATRLECKTVRIGESANVASCTLVTQGCTDPGLPNTEVAVVYTRPDGSTAVRYVTTDAAGCFVDLETEAAPGLWQVGTELEEEDCRVGATTPRNPVFVPPVYGRFRIFGVFTGGNWPVNDLDDYSPAFMFAIQGEQALNDHLTLGLQVGYHAFDAEPSAGVDNLGFTNLSAIARFVGSGTVIRPFALAGFGGYHSDSGWDPGVQLGVGIDVPVTSAVSLAAGTAFHLVDRGGKTGRRPQWLDGYLGFLVALP